MLMLQLQRDAKPISNEAQQVQRKKNARSDKNSSAYLICVKKGDKQKSM